jgi:outer membrane protein assembly factor BamB
MHRRLALSCALAVLFAAPAHAGQPAYHGDGQHTGFYPITGPQDPQLRWKVDLAGAVISTPVLGPDGTIYLGSVLRDTRHPAHFITAVRPDGTIKWQFPTGWRDAQTQSSPAVGADGRIYVGAQDGFFYALNPDGTLAWKFQALSPVQQHPVVGPDGNVYVGLDGKLFSFTSTGEVRWSAVLGTTSLPGGPALSAPTVADDGTVMVLSGEIVAVRPDGTERWRYAPSAAYYNSYGSVSVSPSGDVVFSFGWYLGKLRLLDGSVAWQIDFLGGEYNNELESTYAAPVIDGKGAIFLGLGTGKRWTRPWGKVIRGYGPGGDLVWEFPVGEGTYTSSGALAADGTLYMGAMDGFLYALRDGGPPPPPPPNGVESLTLDPHSVAASATSKGTVTLKAPAPVEGATVVLDSPTVAAVRVPPTVFVAAGAKSATFDVVANTVTDTTTVTICGRWGDSNACDTMTITASDPGGGRRRLPGGVR